VTAPASIRRARADELTRVQEIERAAGALFEGQPVTLDDAEPTERSELEAACREGELFVATDADDRAVGFAMLGEVGGHAHLWELDVHPDHGRRGIGRALLEHVCQAAAEAGHRRITLTTFAEVPWNAPFYRRAGFFELRGEAIGPALRELLAEEARGGLDPAERCCMARELAAPGGASSG
jgi:GNAT superfamily N-acetyltransferase